jgi:hypothetical protein
VTGGGDLRDAAAAPQVERAPIHGRGTLDHERARIGKRGQITAMRLTKPATLQLLQTGQSSSITDPNMDREGVAE